MQEPLLNAVETSRRVRAARAYGRLSREKAAEVMGVDVGQFDRYQGTKPGELRLPRLEQLWSLADECGLSRDWFLADLDRLAELVPDGLPKFASPAQQRAALEEAAQASEAAAQQLQPTTAPDAAEQTDQPSGDRPARDRRAP